MINNNKGQAFEAYKLLIAFIIAVAVLGIILTMVNKTNNQALIISDQKIEDAFISAINSPVISMEKPFIVKEVLVSGIISYAKYENLGGLEPGCFGFIVGPGVSLEAYGAEIESRFLKTDVYFSCGFNMNVNNLQNTETYFEITTGANSPIDTIEECEKLFCVMYINKRPAVLTN